MHPLPPEQLYVLHDYMSIVMLIVCVLICYAGYTLTSQTYKKYVSYTLVAFCILQEGLDYVNRIYLDELYNFSLSTDLPLQFCVIGFYLSIFGIIMNVSSVRFNPKLEQFLFDVAYVLGFGGALQALLNVDLTGVNNMIGIFTLNWTHSLIIINVLWLVFAYGKRFNAQSIINSFMFINVVIFPVGIINYFLNANYMFICSPPAVDSSFFIGDWPYYLLYLEIIYFIYIFILYLPFKLAEKYSIK